MTKRRSPYRPPAKIDQRKIDAYYRMIQDPKSKAEEAPAARSPAEPEPVLPDDGEHSLTYLKTG